MAKRSAGGRPTKPKDEQLMLVPVRFPPALIDRADAICEARPDQPQRSALLREATAIGLEVLEARLKGRK